MLTHGTGTNENQLPVERLGLIKDSSWDGQSELTTEEYKTYETSLARQDTINT